MKKLLIVKSSPFQFESIANKLIKEIEKELDESQIIDLNVLNYEFLTKNEVINLSALENDTIDKVVQSNHLFIVTPIWNLMIPSILKNWIEHSIVQGKVFIIGERGGELIAGPVKMTVLFSSKANLSSDKFSSLNIAELYLKTYFNFIGVKDIEFFYINNEHLLFNLDELRNRIFAQ